MAKHTLTMHDIGDKVKITGGAHAGKRGTVVAHMHVGPRAPDTVHQIKLDEPATETAKRATDLGGGRMVTESEEVYVTHAEAPASDIEEV